MKTLLLAVLCAMLFTSCGYFSRKMDETMKEGSRLMELQNDSTKNVLSAWRTHDTFDSVFTEKMDTLYTSGFKLYALSDSVMQNESYMAAYEQELSVFRNYVNKNFDYNDQLSSLMPLLDAGIKMKDKDMPLSVKGTKQMMQTVAQKSILDIIALCRAQYKGPKV